MRSRLTRLEEKRVKKRIILFLGSSMALVVLLVLFGVPLLVRVSVLIGNSKPAQNSPQDTTPAFIPVLNPLPDATNSAQIALKGYGEPNATVHIFQNGQEIKTMRIGNDGDFTLDTVELHQGKNVFTANTVNLSHTTSDFSSPVTILYSTTPPKLEITNPLQDHQTTSNQLVTFSGATDPGAEVLINGRFVTVGDDGSFQFPYKLQDGDNKITIIATDHAGNQTTVERTITYSH